MIYNSTYIKDLEAMYNANEGISRLFGKNVLITGATGLIGSSIVDCVMYLNLFKGANINLFLGVRNVEKATSQFCCYLCNKQFNIIRFDATDYYNELPNVDYVIYGASLADPNYYVNKPAETIQTNIIGINTILSKYKGKNTKVLFVSSSEVYGNKNNNHPYVENEFYPIDITKLRASYPIGKQASEVLCLSYHKEYGTDISIVRPGHIYGPSSKIEDSRVSNIFMREAIEGKDLILKSTGEQKRSYCYSIDCASAILFVLAEGLSGEAYNIASIKTQCTLLDFVKE